MHLSLDILFRKVEYLYYNIFPIFLWKKKHTFDWRSLKNSINAFHVAIKCCQIVKFDDRQIWLVALFTDYWVLVKLEEWQRGNNGTAVMTSPITTFEGNSGLWSGCVQRISPAVNHSTG